MFTSCMSLGAALIVKSCYRNISVNVRYGVLSKKNRAKHILFVDS